MVVNLGVALQQTKSSRYLNTASRLHGTERSDVDNISLSAKIAVVSVWPSRSSQHTIQ